MQFFQFFLPLKGHLMDILSETCAVTSRANVAEKGITIWNCSETLRLLWLLSSVFDLEKNPQKS